LPFKLLLTQANQYNVTFTLTSSAVYSHYAIARYIIKSSRGIHTSFRIKRKIRYVCDDILRWK